MTLRAVLSALTLAVSVTACGGTSPPPRAFTPAASPGAVALAYMRAHPVQPGPGMTAGIVLTSDDAGFIGAAAREAQCPATPPAPAALTAYTAGNQPACLAWSATVETPSGQVAAVSCGSIASRRACPPALTAPGVYIPMPGDYVRFRSGGTVTVAGDIRDIAMFAVDIPAPDTGGPVWVTTSASPAVSS